MENVGSNREDFKDIFGRTIRAVVVVLPSKSFKGPSENSLMF